MKNNLDFNEFSKMMSNLAKDTKDTINSQVSKFDLDDVLKQVSDVLDDTMKSISKEFDSFNAKAPADVESDVVMDVEADVVVEVEVEEEHTLNNKYQHKNANTAKPIYIKREKKVEFTVNKIPSVTVEGVLLAVFGGIGTFVWGAFLSSFRYIGNDILSIVGGSLVSGLLIVSIGMLIAGIKKIERNSRFKKYRKRIGNTFFCDLRLLMEDVGKRKKVVMKDMKVMHTLGYIQAIYFDKEKKSVILDSETYRYYKENTKKKFFKQNIDNAEVQDENHQETNENTNEEQSNSERELKEILEKGTQQLIEIKKLNEMIEGPVISQKITKFYKITNVIFDVIQKTPSKINDIRKVHEYYLPTVIKMLSIYVKLNVQVEETQNIRESKEQIEGALDTLNKGFEELLNSLFEDDALDIYSDISVLNMVLTQDGLIGNDDFKMK